MISNYDTEYRKLNDRQREAVDAIEGPVMVIAGPGTGKTTMLTLRIGAILARTDTPPEAVLALTFTENAAAEMRGRLAALIGSPAHRVTMTTFHAFCNRVIADHPDSFPHLAGALPLSEADQAELVGELLAATPALEPIRPSGAPEHYLAAAIRAIGTLKREAVTPQGLLAMAEVEERAVMSADDLHHAKGAYAGKMKGAYAERLKRVAKWRALSVLATAYEAALRARRAYDYDDMVMETATALERDEPLRLSLMERYLYVLVDEHQDTNNAQNRVLELIASFWERPNLFVVGDEKQAIYRFQGASLANFLYFRSKFPDVKLIALSDNYRSTQIVLDAAHTVRPSATPLKARAEHAERPIAVLSFSDEDAERHGIARMVRERLESGTQPAAIAVLVRTNAQARLVGEALSRSEIPAAVSADDDLWSDPHIDGFLHLLEAVRSYGDAGPLLTALHAPPLGIDPLDLYKLASFCRGGRNPYDVIASRALMHEAGIGNAERLADRGALLARWATMAGTTGAAEAFGAVLEQSGVLAAMLGEPDVLVKLARLHALYDLLRLRQTREHGVTLAVFTEHLAFLRSRGIALRVPDVSGAPHRVRVLTAHKAKGLEFDVVIIAHAADDVWGAAGRGDLLPLPDGVFVRGNAPTASDDDGDERNLFFVALTRARSEVLVTYAGHDARGNPRERVRFLLDMRPELLAEREVAEYEADWASRRDSLFTTAPPAVARPDERAWVADQLAHRGLSVTALNNYLRCPWQYFYTNLLRVPEPPSFPLMYGSAVDAALEHFFKAGGSGDAGDLITRFQEAARKQPFSSVELDTALARGRDALSGYHRTYHSSWGTPSVRYNQYRVPAVELPDGTLINGKMDRIDVHDDSTAVVIDYKTGKPKSKADVLGTTKSSDGSYWRQLVFYKLLLDRHDNGRIRMTQGVIDFVEPADSGGWKRYAFEVTREHTAALEQEVMRVAEEIRTLAFWDRTCDDRACHACRLRAVMHREKDRSVGSGP